MITDESQQRITDLENELQFTRESLQATVEELETSNEELQATNEELLASNEELQSTNEELQSVNEELYTVNTEYQDKISELTNVNNDLDNLLSSTNIATLFLDEELNIRRFTPEVAVFFNIVEQDIGRPFNHFTHDLGTINIDEVIDQVRESNQAIEEEVQNSIGSYFLMRVAPYRIGPNLYSGIVLSFVNIDKTKRITNELVQTERQFRRILEQLDMIAVQVDLQGRIVFANDYFLNMTGYVWEEILGTDWRQCVEWIGENPFAGEQIGEEIGNFESMLKCNGGDQHVWWSNTLLSDSSGKPTGVSMIGYRLSDLECQLAADCENRVVVFSPASDG